MQGELDVVALECSLQEIIKRHEVLRTTFVSMDGEPIQVIAPSLTIPIPMSDLQHLPMSERLAEARRLATVDGLRPFDLMQGPLIRALLFVLGPDEYVFTQSMHHIVSDGWSIGILLQELFALYSAFASGTPPQLPDLPIQYADYALWQRQWMQDDVLKSLLAYWKQKLEGAPPAIAFPTDRPRPIMSASQGASVSVLLSQPLSEALRMLSRQREATLFMTMLTVLNIVLFQWTGQSDMVVGTVLANRSKPETEKLIGCFLNFLALRSQISEQMTGLELLAEVKGTVIEAYMHQDYPFEKLVAALNPIRKPNQYPLYNIAFLLQNFPFSPDAIQTIFSPSTDGKTLQFSLLPLERQAALLDLRLIAEETPKGILLECEYDRNLFDAATIEQLLASYTHVVETFVQTPTVSISSFDISLEAQARAARAREHTELSTLEQALHTMAAQQHQLLRNRQRTAPRTETERRLVEIWTEVFRQEQIGIHDNFFALGGDSILSVRVISKARQTGIYITPQQLMASQTIAELSDIVRAASPLQAEQGMVTGLVPLVPMQNWFFGKLKRHDPHHWNIARLIEVSPQMLNPALWMRAVEYLLLYHDTLRTRFVQNKSGLQQFIAIPDSRVPFVTIDLSALSEAKQRAAIESSAGNLQLSLNLSEGPILRVALFDLGKGRPGRLLLIVHHLVADGFSFTLLLEDLHTAYEQLSCGKTICLPPKTTSHKQWAEQLIVHAQSEHFHRELASFLSLPWTKAVPLPLDYPIGRGTNTVATIRQVKAILSVEETNALLQKVQTGADIQLIEVLLAALAYTLSRWVGGHQLPVDVVHHGRETCFDDVDLTRTIGLCIYNINTLFDLENADTPQAALSAVKEQFRRINHVVLGCAGDRTFVVDECVEPWATVAEKTKAIPCSDVCFNYYGQVVDGGGILPSQFRPAPESIGMTESRQNLDFYTFYCRGIINDEQFTLCGIIAKICTSVQLSSIWLRFLWKR